MKINFNFYSMKNFIIIIIKTFVWTVNLTLSRSLRASDMSTNNDVSERSIVSVRGYKIKEKTNWNNFTMRNQKLYKP